MLRVTATGAQGMLLYGSRVLRSSLPEPDRTKLGLGLKSTLMTRLES